MEGLRPLVELSADAARSVRFVLTDIDDTLTRDGLLELAAFRALWRLHDAGFCVIPVTGRPAGWCDLIIREWPVEAVVGENGAFAYYRERGRICTLTHPSVPQERVRARLTEVRDAVLTEVPLARVARDQFARIYDLAIDFREDPPRLSLAEAERIKAVCERFGAHAKISSIHVNTWFGDYDKLGMTRLLLAERFGVADEGAKEDVLFCGDSPNDEPMFHFFPFSVGVANVRPYLPLMKALPAFVSEATNGEGFEEIADHLLELRGILKKAD